MQPTALPPTDYLDLIYQGRNKSYGSYELRRNYAKRMRTALLALLAIGLSASAFGLFAAKPETEISKPKVKGPTILTKIPVEELPPVVPPPPAPVSPPPAKPTFKLTPPVITPDHAVKPDDLPPDLKKVEGATAGTKTSAGSKDGTDGALPNTSGAGSGNVLVETPPAPPATPFITVEQMPEFNGDVQRWLADNVNYPDQARESGIEGRVVIKFVVSEDGSVTEAMVERGVNSALDAEALRAVKRMPKWKPGKQNGKAVKVYYRVPVKFALE